MMSSTFFQDNLYRMLTEAMRVNDVDGDMKVLIQIFAEELDKMKDSIDGFPDLMDVDRVPDEFLHFLANFVGIAELGDDLMSNDMRRFIRMAVSLYKTKGTVIGIKKLARAVLGNIQIELTEHWKTMSPNEVHTDKTPSTFYATVDLSSLEYEGITYVLEKYDKFNRILPNYIPANVAYHITLVGFMSFEVFKLIEEALVEQSFSDYGEETLPQMSESEIGSILTSLDLEIFQAMMEEEASEWTDSATETFSSMIESYESLNISDVTINDRLTTAKLNQNKLSAGFKLFRPADKYYGIREGAVYGTMTNGASNENRTIG